MNAFKDHFSGHSRAYREARPTYPPALFAWLAVQSPDKTLAWDCGRGNGQATVALVDHFSRVIGTDPIHLRCGRVRDSARFAPEAA